MPIYLEDGSLPAKELDEQVEQEYNKLLDSCSNFRDSLGEVADHISLGVPLQQFWEDACALRKHLEGDDSEAVCHPASLMCSPENRTCIGRLQEHFV